MNDFNAKAARKITNNALYETETQLGGILQKILDAAEKGKCFVRIEYEMNEQDRIQLVQRGFKVITNGGMDQHKGAAPHEIQW